MNSKCNCIVMCDHRLYGTNQHSMQNVQLSPKLFIPIPNSEYFAFLY